MDKVNSDVLEEIINFKIDSGANALTFVKRLARENNWSESYAERCVVEYKRFVYLMMVSDSPVTPSDQVDQVWHLHLTYTHSYWVELCGALVGRPLHHGPTKGGVLESKKYRSQYDSTLTAYKEVFNEHPPQDIWPPCYQRFDNADKFIRLNSADYFVFKRKPVLSLAGVTLLPLTLAACVSDEQDVIAFGVLGVIGFVGLCFLVRTLFVRIRRNKSDGAGGGACGSNHDDGGGCSSGSGCGGCGG